MAARPDTLTAGTPARVVRIPRSRTPEAFSSLYRTEFHPLLRIAYGLTGTRAEAEELVQETFIRCYQHWRRVEAYDKPGAWLRRVLINLASSRRRRLATEVRALTRLGARPTGTAGPSDELGDVDEAFWAAVRRLPRRQAQAVVLYYGDDLATDDVARAMGCAEGTVRALLHQARTALATVLDTEEQR
jgi:RNA polymerase sigma-70 factor (sigma-E family)